MSYIGVQSQNQVSPAFHREVVTPDGSASFFDLIQDVPGYNADNILVVVNNVVQHPNDSYTIKADANGNPRRLDFAGTVPAATDVIYVTHRGVGTLNITPAAGTVTSVSLSDNLRSGNVDSFAGSDHAVISSNSTFTLSEIPLNSDSISVFVNGVYQKPTTNYSVDGTTTRLTFVGQIVSTDEIDVHHHTIRTGVVHVADGSVTSAKIADDAVGAAAIADDAITGGKLANDIAISTTGNIATTGSGTLTVAGATNLASVATGTLASAVVFPAGMPIFMESKTLAAVQNITAHFPSAWTDVTNLTITWTPKLATNYVYMTGTIHAGVSTDSLGAGWRWYVSGGGTDGVPTGSVGTPTSAPMAAGGKYIGGYQMHEFSAQHKFRLNDAIPNWSSGALTIKIQAAVSDGSHTMRINKAGNNSDDADYPNPISSFSITEIAG